MACVYKDSFDHFVSGDITEKWTSAEAGGHFTIVASEGRRSTAGANIGGASVGSKKVLAAPAPSGSTFIASFSIRQTAGTPNGSFGGMVVRALNGSVNLCGLCLLSDFKFCFKIAGATGTTVSGSTSTNAISQGGEYHCQMKIVLATGATGSVQLLVNGVEWINVSSVTTSTGGFTTWDTLGIGTDAAAVGSTCYIDDLFVCDASGSANNSLPGDIRIDLKKPNAEGTTIQATPSTGTDNSANVDDSAPDDGSTYNEFAAGNLDLYGMENLSTGANVKAFTVLGHVAKTDAGVATVRPVVRHSGTNYTGTEVGVGTSYGYTLRQVYDVNPGTSAEMTESEWNAIEIGIERTT